MKTLKEYLLQEGLKTGYWHGENAWILNGNKKDGYAILVGGYDEAEAKKVQRLVNADKPLGDYEDFVIFADPDEWKEQND